MKNATVGPIGWRGRFWLCGSRQIPGGFPLPASGLGKGQSFVEHQVVLLVGLRGGAPLLLLQKAEKHPVAIPGCAELPAVQLVPPGRLLIKIVYYTFPGLCKGVVRAGPAWGGFSASSPRAAHSSSPIPASAALLHSQTPCWSPAKRRKG